MAWPAAARPLRHRLARRIGWQAPFAARLRRHVVERVGVVSSQEVQGKDGNYHDQHDDGHKDNQDRSDHHTIPPIWPWDGTSKARAATCASLPRDASTLNRAADPLEQRLCRTLYALSRNSGSFTESLG
jgi:hypothetical protein